MAFSRSVRWRLVSGSPGARTGAWSGGVAADARPVSVLPASAATAGTAGTAALRARNERRFVEDMAIPFDGWRPQKSARASAFQRKAAVRPKLVAVMVSGGHPVPVMWSADWCVTDAFQGYLAFATLPAKLGTIPA